ncbi:hypothetical protein [uncultured Methanobrevibacter sp.]|uniref:hypothetical protein n=1 Tax=uncultured Methanobrevibacter sp. TaxID=253161 RepID=UPI0026296E77|nr:hypothetical protein [uncultured Methanobrevibacter sp.]
MRKSTIFAITFFLLSLVVLFSFHAGSPVPGGNKFHLPEPREIDVNGVNFTISWGFLEDSNSSDNVTSDVLFNHEATKGERTFHQNDILLLAITVYDFNGYDVTYDDLELLNDGSYVDKSIKGIDGIFKNESVETHTGFVKNNHQRYYFNYIKDGRIVMIQCDKLSTIDEIVK